jgi:hypothetical protein
MLTVGTLTRHYTARELLECAMREVRHRRVRYASRVLTGRMSQQQADAEIDKMAAIAEMLAVMAERERLL